MVEEPDNLVLGLLREIREVLDEHSRILREHSEEFRSLRKDMQEWNSASVVSDGN